MFSILKSEILIAFLANGGLHGVFILIAIFTEGLQVIVEVTTLGLWGVLYCS
jgi:hypothetical protein